MNNIKANNFTKKAMYFLNKEHGQCVNLYLRGVVSQDVESGDINCSEVVWKIKRVPVLEIETVPSDVRAYNFSAAGRQFEYGGNFVVTQTHIIVYKKFLPKGYRANKTDRFIIKHRSFVISDFKELQDEQIVDFTVTELVGQQVAERFIHNVKDTILTQDGVTK